MAATRHQIPHSDLIIPLHFQRSLSVHLQPSCPTKYVNSLRYRSSLLATGTRCVSRYSQALKTKLTTYSSLHVAQNLPRKVLIPWLHYMPSSCSLVFRIRSNLQGSRSRFRCHGLHWLFRQAHPHTHVRFTSLCSSAITHSHL